MKRLVGVLLPVLALLVAAWIGALVCPRGDAVAQPRPPVTAVDGSSIDAGASDAGVPDASSVDRRIDPWSICQTGSGTVVPAGNEREARGYYDAAARAIGLHDFATLDGVIRYMGHASNAARLQDTAPSELMASAPSGTVLSARFFAPKITDVSSANAPARQVGWRKLVRLLPTTTSDARANGIDAAFILFNFFAPIEAQDPFLHADSVNTQVMLIASQPDMSPIYWFDYGPTQQGAQLSFHLDAFFDAGHTPRLTTGPARASAARPYYVPCGCISCHGGFVPRRTQTASTLQWDPRAPMLNYLDTDHWFDRVASGEDFAGLAAPVIFDPGGFEVLRSLNQEILAQNRRVALGSAEQRAAAHWLDLHASNPGHVADLAARALPTGPGVASWDAGNADDIAALRLFNRYCFRCHGSVGFDVFDHPTLLSMRSLLLAVLHPRPLRGDPRTTMPPDRDLSPPDLATLRRYVLTHTQRVQRP